MKKHKFAYHLIISIIIIIIICNSQLEFIQLFDIICSTIQLLVYYVCFSYFLLFNETFTEIDFIVNYNKYQNERIIIL